MCEHYGYTLRQALWELYGVRWEQAPAGLHWTILEMRAYAQAYEQVKLHRQDSKRHPLEVTPMVQRVREIQMAIGMEKQARADEQPESD